MRLAQSLHLRSFAVVILSALAVVLAAGPSAAFTFTTIDVPGASATQAWGINKPGLIVGEFVDHTGTQHGFLRQLDGSFTTIDVPGASATRPRSINKVGQIVGEFTDANGDHGFLRDVSGSFTTIDIPGGHGTAARGINGLARSWAFTTPARPSAASSGRATVPSPGSMSRVSRPPGPLGSAARGSGALSTIPAGTTASC